MVRHRIWLLSCAAALGALFASAAMAQETRVPPPATATHPMDALTPDEIRAATALLKAEGKLDANARLVSLSFVENPKAAVRGWRPGMALDRQALAVILAGGKLFEGRVDLTNKKLAGWNAIPNRQATIMADEMLNASDLPKKDPRWQAAMAKRGFTSYEKVACFPLAAGPAADPRLAGHRLLNVPCVDITGAENNLWGKPIEGVLTTVDLSAGKVLDVIDLGVVPAPPEVPSHAYADSGRYRPVPKPIEIAAPQGTNVTVEGGQVRWDNWSFHVRLDPRLGTILSLIRFDDHGTWRDVAYQLSASEMFVPYMDSAKTWAFRAYMDIGEYGFGALTTQLRPGQDCPASAHFLDLVIADSKGEPIGQKGVVCVFERPTGAPVWRHDEMLNGSAEARPDVELVVRMAPVVGNYDYLIDYVFDRAGAIDTRVGAYGIDATKGVKSMSLRDPGAAEEVAHGTLIAPRILAVNHDHYVAFRIDMDVDGTGNRLVQDVFKPERAAGGGPRKSLWRPQTQAVATEGPVLIPLDSAQFRVESSERTNRLGYPTSYQIMAGHTASSLLAKDDPIQKRAGFSAHPLWATAYAADEKYASGVYPNQNPEIDGLPRWVAAKRPIKDRDLVLWYTVGFRHIPRSEDWPAMPALWHGFKLRPFNFFDRNPALDVPPVTVKAAK